MTHARARYGCADGRYPLAEETPAAERRPVILATDDDPVVPAAVARGLRRGVGERFRLMPPARVRLSRTRN
jgi:hypothetical protein